ncbi:DUF2076 domain-containing protein [Nocardia sp. NBC_01327]|uniref:DUF2076 domain-containing protein n=1 Tax=Nocardia sp. NBC_01327 TaxID=2903593 RepID=UPI003FA399F1
MRSTRSRCPDSRGESSLNLVAGTGIAGCRWVVSSWCDRVLGPDERSVKNGKEPEMNTSQAQQIVDGLFQKIDRQGPRDPQVQALVQQRVAHDPGAIAAMAQMLIRQDQAIAQLQQENVQLRQQVLDYQQRGDADDRRSGGSDFLSGAVQIALGVGGGILAADVLGDVFDGGDSWW